MEPTGFGGKVPISVALEGSQPIPKVSKGAPERESGKKISHRPKIETSTGSFPGSQETLKAVANGIRSFLEDAKYSLEFIPNQKNGRVTIRVLDSAGKLIREIPPEEIVRLSRNIGSGTGVLVDERLK
jgi:uncharacterized FlaG/YvyC family protein